MYKEHLLKDRIAKRIAYLVPKRAMRFCIVRAFAHATHEYPKKSPE